MSWIKKLLDLRLSLMSGGRRQITITEPDDPKRLQKFGEQVAKDYGENNYFARLYQNKIGGVKIQSFNSAEEYAHYRFPGGYTVHNNHAFSCDGHSSLGVDLRDWNKTMTILPPCEFGCGNAPCSCYEEYQIYIKNPENYNKPYFKERFETYVQNKNH